MDSEATTPMTSGHIASPVSTTLADPQRVNAKAPPPGQKPLALAQIPSLSVVLGREEPQWAQSSPSNSRPAVRF